MRNILNTCFKIFPTVIIIAFILLFLFFKGFPKNSEKGVTVQEEIVIEEVVDTVVVKNLSLLDSLKYEVSKYPFKYPSIIVSQAILESGLKSRLFLSNNNLFGMKVPGRRVTVAKGNAGEYAYYNNWQESVLDRFIFESIYCRQDTEEEYLKYLTRVYAEDPEYNIKLEKIRSNL